MIDYLKGRLVSAVPGRAVVDLGGVGLALEMPPGSDDLAGRAGEEITFFTRLLFREDEIYIYGFRTEEQRQLFNLILSVSGFGPRIALSLLGVFSVTDFYLAVLEDNIPFLCRAHGVGRKAAQRLVLELKEKLPQAVSSGELAVERVMPVGSSVSDDIVEALFALGYSRVEAAAAAGKAISQNSEASREDLLRLALKSMSER